MRSEQVSYWGTFYLWIRDSTSPRLLLAMVTFRRQPIAAYIIFVSVSFVLALVAAFLVDWYQTRSYDAESTTHGGATHYPARYDEGRAERAAPQ